MKKKQMISRPNWKAWEKYRKQFDMPPRLQMEEDLKIYEDMLRDEEKEDG